MKIIRKIIVLLVPVLIFQIAPCQIFSAQEDGADYDAMAVNNLPNNALPLTWPAESCEVTLWFGTLGHPANSGIDIQDKIDANVFSISDGIVSFVGSSSLNGNQVFVDFKAIDRQMEEKILQARYIHLNPDIKLQIGDSVKVGDIIGTMSAGEVIDDMGTQIKKGIMKIEIRESQYGKICDINGSNNRL